jgi:choline dehydrogenase
LVIETDADGGKRCTGVKVWDGQQLVTATATREVALSAGSIGSAQILQLSGIGAAQSLKQNGVDVVHDLPGVGANLQDHLQIRSVYKVKHAKTLNTLANSWWGKAKIGLEYAMSRSGPMSMAPSQLGAFTKSDPAREWANIQYHVQPLSLDAFGEPLHKFPAITASVCNLNPSSRGSVTLKSPDFKVPPAIAPNYLSTEEDRKVAADSLRVTRRIMSQPAMAAFEPEEFKPGIQYQSDEELAKLAGDIASTIFHPVGTTRMGREDDPMAVVNSHLQVRGVRGLRVVDAGVMPSITSGNTNSPTLMIAEKAAHWMAKDAQGFAAGNP